MSSNLYTFINMAWPRGISSNISPPICSTPEKSLFIHFKELITRRSARRHDGKMKHHERLIIRVNCSP